jgi:hypothetical protein
MTGVPREWMDMIAHLDAAARARLVMKNPDVRQADRDLATADYVRAVDLVIDNLSALRASHVLGRFTQFLAKAERK